VGIPDDKGNILLPLNHITKSNSDICITIDGEGKFRYADKSKLTIPVPCTEESGSHRSGSSIFPHPLHDQIEYLSTDTKKREKYLSQLSEWSGMHAKVEAVYRYILKNTIVNDLQVCGIRIKEKLFIRFSVESPGDPTPELWKDKTVAEAWQAYCKQNYTGGKELCYVTGELLQITDKHPKNINNLTSNAKLISCNDSKNYTYRGRFSESEQANAISFDASHKAHAMLQFLITTQGYRCGSQAIVAWGIDNGEAQPDLFEDSLGLYGKMVKTERETLIAMQNELAHDYAKKLSAAMKGYGDSGNLKNFNQCVAIITVDAASDGRMAVTFYKDLPKNEYIQRIVNWHETCCWYFRDKGKTYIAAPHVDKIIAAVYGEPKGEGYFKIQKQARERILNLIMNGAKFDKTWLNAAVNRVSNPFSYDKPKGGWDSDSWERAINVTCAIAKKYYSDIKEEMELELNRTLKDRDYLYGRMLAIADKIESYARYLQEPRADTEKHPTNAVRYMSAFAARPFMTWTIIYHQLNPYFQRLNGGEGYQMELDEIMSLFPENEYENNKPLNGKYLMGYSLQRRALNTSKDKDKSGGTKDAQ